MNAYACAPAVLAHVPSLIMRANAAATTFPAVPPLLPVHALLSSTQMLFALCYLSTLDAADHYRRQLSRHGVNLSNTRLASELCFRVQEGVQVHEFGKRRSKLTGCAFLCRTGVLRTFFCSFCFTSWGVLSVHQLVYTRQFVRGVSHLRPYTMTPLAVWAGHWPGESKLPEASWPRKAPANGGFNV
jgi:hypothetical protein